ncbi:hypothetical protein KP509_08G014100 [Ceratopteris richardii]|uniref:SHSP domain-containing protein n=1 Tax=Ceratopteris richardii TaxID=49495 RepID=A0A8T2UAH1_CERRI|nr:hypothetical protein KP509_08G014100 [Ceratopteris richardii]
MAACAPVDVKELGGSYIFVVDVRNTEVKVQIEKDSVLKISGQRNRDMDRKDVSEAKYLRVERPVGHFMRKFNLPNNVDLDSLTAACQDGMLTIIVPKLPEATPHKPRTFEVAVGTTLIKQ